MRRVVITGVGTVNPLANNVEETWKKVMNKESGIAPITRFDTADFTSKIAGEVKNFDYTQFFKDVKTAKRLNTFVHYGAAAMYEAVNQSGITWEDNPYKIGICIGSGIGGIQAQHDNSAGLIKRGNKGISPLYIPAAIGNIASGFLSMEYGIKGPNLSTQTACATANHSMAVALMIIQSGMADAMVTGGCESTIEELSVGGFCRMRALSTKYNDDPTKASRPYDKDRDGFVISEGAGVLILEEYEHAKKRGADIICEVLAVGMSGDAYDLVVPDPEGKGAYASMKLACDMAKINPTDINYINTHGTSTPLGDIAEAGGVYKLVGGDESNLNVGSTKSYHGHLLGATAGLEAILCTKAMQEGKVPANINIDNFDEKVPLSCINTEIVEKEVNIALSNSFGFGGHNSSLLLKKI